MPLLTAGITMGDQVIAAMDAVVQSYTSDPSNTPDVKAMRKALVEAMCTAICQQICANALLAITGVQPGVGVAVGTIT
jgi:hypothetical protein